jgi:membrane protease YdiL (CAAX protease family)
MIDFNDFIKFLKNPSLENQVDINSFSTFLKLVWKSFFIILAADIILGLLFCGPLIYFNLFPSLKVINLSLLSFLKIILYYPILEEVIFRLPLRISSFKLILPFSILFSLLVYKHYIFNFYLVIFLFIILFFSLYLLIREDSSFFLKIISFFTTRFRWVFYLQAGLFGFLHLTNYNLNLKYFYLFPLFIVNYIFTGLFWGYLRVRYSKGIYLCIASHILVNCIYCFILRH